MSLRYSEDYACESASVPFVDRRPMQIYQCHLVSFQLSSCPLIHDRLLRYLLLPQRTEVAPTVFCVVHLPPLKP